MVRLPPLLAAQASGRMERSKTVQVFCKSLTPEQSLEMEKPKWPPLKGQKSERKGLSVVGNRRTNTVTRTLSSADIRLSRSGSSVGEPGFERTVLEDENRRLREELARYQTESLERHRRPLAAIAGGGFRAMPAAPRSCMCKTLKVKLARCRAALHAAQRKNSLSWEQLESRFDLGEDQHTELPEMEALATEEAACQTEGQTAHAEVQSSVLTATAEVQASECCLFSDGAAQTDPVAEAQLLPELEEKQELPCQEAAVQVTPSCLDCGVQSEVSLEHCASQTEVAVEDVAAQTEVMAQHSATQTEVPGLRHFEVQTEVLADAETLPEVAVTMVSTEMQTVALEVKIMTSTEMQTSCTSFVERFVQATVESVCNSAQVSCAKTSAATQVEKRKMNHQATQAEDSSAVEVAQRLKDLEDSVAAGAMAKAKELEAWQQMATSKAMSRLNVTILCPRAECTVNGSKVEMDSWNSARLREDFEEQVLPRFIKIIMAEGETTSQTEIVQNMMEELGSIFRERLAAILSAPNATAAMAAAKGRAEKPPHADATEKSLVG